MSKIDRMLRTIDPAPIAPQEGRGARELMEEIVATPAEVRRRWSWPVLLPLAAVIALAAVVGVAFLPKKAPIAPSAALAFQRSGDDWIVTVSDLYADPERYREEFRARGLDIELSFTPGSPSVVGSVVYLSTTEIVSLTNACATDPTGCTISLRIPAKLSEKAAIVLARPARPGEKYDTMGFVNAPGELLHCVAFENITVGELRKVLAKRDGSITDFRIMVGGESRKVTAMQVPDHWFVQDVTPHALGEVRIWAGPEPAKRPGRREPAESDACRSS
ncbi:hypothetical protein ACIBHY_40395 [Nonomuraea sp. NPDC050547]|uniref:hypothetical protein n=1 Tax=Nonomuraea sp. NPDC050547 TaxID=3364368 RepID=UPI003796A254